MAYQQQQLHQFLGYPYPTPVPSAKSRFIELLKKHYLPINKFINEHIQIGVNDLTNLDHSRFVELCTFFKLNPVEKIRFEKLVNELSFGEEHFNHNNKASIDTYNHNKTIATSMSESLFIQQLDNEHKKMQYISKLAQFMINRTNDKCSICHDEINKIFDAQKEKIIHLLQNKQQQIHDYITEFTHNQLSFIQNELKTIDEYQAEIRQTRSACSTVLESQQYGQDREDTISQIIQSLLSVNANHKMYRNIQQLNKSLAELTKEVTIEYEATIIESCIDKLLFIEPVINQDMKNKIIQINQLCTQQPSQRKTRGVSLDNHINQPMLYHTALRNRPHSFAYNDYKLFDNINDMSLPLPRYSPPGHTKKAMSFSQLNHDALHLNHSLQMPHSNGSSSVHSQLTLTQSESNHDDDGDIQALIMETIDMKDDDESEQSHAHSIEAMYEPGKPPMDTKDNDTPNPDQEKEDPLRIDSIDITDSDYLDCNPREILNELNDKEAVASSQYAVKWAVYGVGNNMSYQFGLNHNNNILDFEQMKWNIDDAEDEKKEVIDTHCLLSMTSGSEWSMYLFGGGLYCCGSNASGCFAMGKDKKGTYIQSLTQHPFFDSNNLHILYLSSGCTSHHTFVKTDNNQVYAMGESSHYQLALDSEEMAKHKTNFWPQKISSFDCVSVSRIACGKKYSIFVTQDGITYSCGSNLFGALGFCDEVTILKKPRIIDRLSRAKAMEVVCGENHSVILDSIGKIWSFGINNEFQLGRNTKNNLDYPGLVHITGRKFSVVGQSSSRMSKIASGANHVAVISESSKLYLWGANERGQLGDGTRKVRYKAKQLILKNELIADVECGANHTVIITKERKVFVCGCNEYYQCQQQSVKSKDNRNGILKPRLIRFNQPDIDQQIKRIFAGHNSTFVAVDTTMDIDRVCV